MKNGKAPGRVMLLDGSTPLVERELTARDRLEYLEQLQPSGAAPFTDEDMTIFAAALKRNGTVFYNFAHYSYIDYCYFFISAITDALDDARSKLT